MHSGRMRTVRCSGRRGGGGGGGVCPGEGVCPGGGCTPPPCGQTDTCENIIFPQLLLRTVKMGRNIVLDIILVINPETFQHV